MRITPLAVWGYRLSESELLNAVQLQTNLTHSNPDANQACYLYCLAIKHLINNVGDAEGAYKKAKSQAGIISEWFDLIETERLPLATKSIGSSIIAFTYSFYFLLRIANGEELTYEEIQRQMLRFGGDTDTNAAIAGGLVGAYFGISQIKPDWVNGLLSFNNTGVQNKNLVVRPKYLIPKHSLVKELSFIINNAPSKLTVTYMGKDI